MNNQHQRSFHHHHGRNGKPTLIERARRLAAYEQEQREINEEEEIDHDGAMVVYKEGLSPVEGWDPLILKERQKEVDAVTTCANFDIQIPYPVESFSELGISKEVRIKEVSVPPGIQRQVLPVLLLGYDACVAVEPRSSVKTSCYVIPAIEIALREKMKRHRRRCFGPSVLIIVPSRFQAAEESVSHHFTTSASGKFEANVDILVSTLGQILYYADPSEYTSDRLLRLSDVSFCVLDETDKPASPRRVQMLSNIVSAFKHPHQTVILVPTGRQSEVDTVSKKTMTRELWTITICTESPGSSDTGSVKHSPKIVKDSLGVAGVYEKLASILQSYSEAGARLVFCNSVDEVKETERFLLRFGFRNVHMLHQRLSPHEKYQVAQLYRNADGNSTAIFVTTDILEENNSHTCLVINVEAPTENSWLRKDYRYRVSKLAAHRKEKPKGKIVTILQDKDTVFFHYHLEAFLSEVNFIKRTPNQVEDLPSPHTQETQRSWFSDESSSEEESSS